MTWLFQLNSGQLVAHAIGIIALVCMAGMALGSVKLRGVGLGTAGVLFAGILVGHFGKPVNKATLDFVKEFGLVLFVFMIGLQLGPGFFAALRRQGLKFNALACAITFRRVVVTDRAVLGKTLGELDLGERFGVAVTRITRADIEMTAVPGLRLQFGDTLQIVGRDDDINQSVRALGNSLKELNETHFIPLFIGIFLGVLVGTMPIALPGLPQPVRLGLAGGPLLVALVLGRFGRIGRLVCHMQVNANIAFRDFGIALFFAAVGLDAGAKFFATVFSATGLEWMLAGACVTMLPLLAVGAFARVVWKMNFIDLSGLLAGSSTNPPALTFATSLAGSDAPAVAYATVYPLTMLLRILCAQVLALALCK